MIGSQGLVRSRKRGVCFSLVTWTFSFGIVIAKERKGDSLFFKDKTRSGLASSVGPGMWRGSFHPDSIYCGDIACLIYAGRIGVCIPILGERARVLYGGRVGVASGSGGEKKKDEGVSEVEGEAVVEDTVRSKAERGEEWKREGGEREKTVKDNQKGRH